MLAELDGFYAVRVTIPEHEDHTPLLSIFAPATEDQAAESLTISGLEAIINLRNAIDEEIQRLTQRIELRDEDIPQ